MKIWTNRTSFSSLSLTVFNYVVFLLMLVFNYVNYVVFFLMFLTPNNCNPRQTRTRTQKSARYRNPTRKCEDPHRAALQQICSGCTRGGGANKRLKNV